MAITVKRLIAELQKIENQYLEVEVYFQCKNGLSKEIASVAKVAGRKVLIHCKEAIKNDY